MTGSRLVLVAGAFIAAGVAHAGAEIRVSLLTSDNVAIAGTYYEPSRQPAPMVLLLHMPTRSRADWFTVATQFAQRGVGSLAIDFRGHGESGVAPGGDPFTPIHPADDARDVEAALAWLKQRPESLPGRVGIVGASLGANLAVLAGAQDPAVHALVLLSATLDFRGVHTEAALRKFGDRAVLLVASQEDGYAARSGRDLAAAGKGTRDLRLLNAAGHGTTMLLREPDVIAALVDWLCARLL